MKSAAFALTLFAVSLAVAPMAAGPQTKKPTPPAPTIPDPAEPFVAMPEQIAAEVGSFISVRPRTNGASVVFYPLDSGLNVFPSEDLKDARRTVVTAFKAGRYRLLAYTAVGSVASQPSVTTIIVGTPPPPPDPVTPVDPVGPTPLPRPPGFAGEVYDQAIAVKDMANAAKLGQACALFAPKLGATIVDPARVPEEFTAVVRSVGLTSAWNPFGAWLLNQLQARAQTIVAANLAMSEVSVGLKAAGGVK